MKVLNTTGRGVMAISFKDRCEALLEDGANEIDAPSTWSEGLVCCVSGGKFAAVLYPQNDGEVASIRSNFGKDTVKWFRYVDAHLYAHNS